MQIMIILYLDTLPLGGISLRNKHVFQLNWHWPLNIKWFLASSTTIDVKLLLN